MTEINTLKKSLLMIQKLKKLLQEQNNKLFEPVAIIGMSCRVPQANNAQEFWELLCQGQNVITAIPDERWELLKETNEAVKRDPSLDYWGGYLGDISAFDAYFFGISPREALRMDPQQRILLEVAYESMEDAGLTVEKLAGSNTGVFSSLYASQFGHLQSLESDMDALLLPTGSAISMAANRLSYLFDLRGPSMVLDTACSSSLVAIQLACLNIQAKLCDQALVSAININLLPSVHAVLSKATMLSPTGQCHTFDAKADGYVQGEGAASIILKPLSKALQDKDKIYAVISGSAVNQDGKTNGLTAPNGLQQEQLLRDAYKAANINPSQVSYIECHGTGTHLGDPIEIQALGEVIGNNREAHKPCWIGSVKTNIGHLEPAAGLIGLVKVALALKNGIIPPHLNFKTTNPLISLDKYGFNIPNTMEQLPRYNGIAVAGVSSFGFGGANAHVVLQEMLKEEPTLPTPTTNHSELFTLSAKDPGALSDLIARWCNYLKNSTQHDLAAICYNLHLKRSNYTYRLAIITSTLDDLCLKLTTLLDDRVNDENVFINLDIKKPNSFSRITAFDSLNLPDLAEQYVQGASIDWKNFEKHRAYAAIDMPFYPWQHKKYWPTLGATGKEVISTTYPLQGKMLSSPLPANQFEFVFNTKILPEIHHTFNVLHAGFYIEMLGFAVTELYQTTLFTLQNLSFLSPLVVLDDKNVSVQLIIDDSSSFIFYSNDGANNWIEHAKGHLVIEESPLPCIDSKNDIINRTDYKGDAASFYHRVTSMGMPAGDSIRWTNQYWLNTNELLSQFRLATPADRRESFTMNMHPGIIDACVQTLFLLLPNHLTKPYIASHMGKVELYGVPDEPMYVYSVLKELHADGKQIIGDWYLLDSHFQLLARCTDLCMTQLNDTMQIDKIMAPQSKFQLNFALPYQECRHELIQFLTEQMAIIFSMPPTDIHINQSLRDLGMDSLMSLAVIRVIESSLGITYSLPLMMKGPSIQEIADYVLATQSVDGEKERDPISTKEGLSWIAHRKIQSKAKVRLFCFPYGGGGASIYRDWQQYFPESIEVCPVQLPGRENRMDEKPLDHLKTLVSLLADELYPLLDKPFAFIGHSFGSLIEFELTRYLRRNNMPQPIHLFASAYPDPSKPSKSLNNLLTKLKEQKINLFELNQEVLGQLDDAQLTTLATIFKDNGLVDYSDVRMNKSIIQVLLPIFVGDMISVKNYVYKEERPLEINTTVFIGKQDAWVCPDDHKGWAKHTLAHCNFVQFDSGHLFIKEEAIRLQIIQTVIKALIPALSIQYQEALTLSENY